MAHLADQKEHCKICNKTFKDWTSFLAHKIASKEHICCLVCGLDFMTYEGCQRHQRQQHAAEQNISCAGCKETFPRMGTYINHIEQKLCRIINAEDFESRLDERQPLRDLKKTGVKVGVPNSALSANQGNSSTPTAISPPIVGPGPWAVPTTRPVPLSSTDPNADGGGRSVLQESTNRDLASLNVDEYPALPKNDYLSGGSKVPDLLTGSPPKAHLVTPQSIWQEYRQKIIAETPLPNSNSMVPIMTVDPVTNKETFHPFDPRNPDFKVGHYFIPIINQYRCPWNACMKKFKDQTAFFQHLGSPAHMDKGLRCPTCLRTYGTATALVQHAEAQGVRCQIRESQEYKRALDQITAGFVDLAGRHIDHTVKYISREDAVAGEGELQARLDENVKQFGMVQPRPKPEYVPNW